MNALPDIQELSIVIVAKNHRPNLLNLSFLQCSDIVPEDWELARQPISNPQAAQIVFRNGVNLTAQANRLTLAEPIANKPLEEIQIPQIANRYAQSLPKMEYETVTVNVRRVISTAAVGEENYIIDKLVAPGPWTQVGNAPVNANVQFSYTLEGKQLIVSVNQGQAQLPEQGAVPVILFAGNFNYTVSGTAQQERLASVGKIFGEWQQDVATFHDIIDTRFLEGTVSIMPNPELVSIPSQ